MSVKIKFRVINNTQINSDSTRWTRIAGGTILEISGIPVKLGESPEGLVTGVGLVLGLKQAPDNIDTHLGSEPDQPPAIIVRFVRQSVRNEVLHLMKVKRDFGTRHLGWTDNDNHAIYVNESLTLYNKSWVSADVQSCQVMDSLFNDEQKMEDSKERGTTKLELIARALTSARKAGSSPKRIPDRVLYARQKNSKVPVIGGTPIDEQKALALRNVVFGSSGAPPRNEWLRTGLGPRSEGTLCYKAPRSTTRGLLTVLQAHLIKFVLFSSKGEPQQPIKLEEVGKSRMQEGLIECICTLLWRIGEKTRAVLTLPQEKCYIYQTMDYFQDGVTEKLHIFEMTNYDDLEIMVKRYSHLFLDDPGPGSLLFLYSAVLTRGVDVVVKDMDGSRPQLIGLEDEGSVCLVTLLLTGRATPYLHNGVIYLGDEEHYAVPKFGVLSRSEIGFLVFGESAESEEGEEDRPGSRLKTPCLPIWVTLSAGHFGLMFNPNRDLLHNYHAERRFDLQYFTCAGVLHRLTVDTRQSAAGPSYGHLDPDQATFTNPTSIDRLIHTKWPDATIIWHGSPPHKKIK